MAIRKELFKALQNINFDIFHLRIYKKIRKSDLITILKANYLLILDLSMIDQLLIYNHI